MKNKYRYVMYDNFVHLGRETRIDRIKIRLIKLVQWYIFHGHVFPVSRVH